MKIEVLFNKQGIVSGIRAYWKKNCFNPPKKENVVDISRFEAGKLIDFLKGKFVRKAKPGENADFETNNLRLKDIEKEFKT